MDETIEEESQHSSSESNDVDENVIVGDISLGDTANLNQYANITKIIVAEDQLVNLQLIKSQITSLGLDSKTIFCTNGLAAYDAVVESLLLAPLDEVRPISFILLDQQMPLKIGI